MRADAGRDRRRHDLAGRVARATYPVRHSVGGFIDGFPCSVMGHRWVEIPRLPRRGRLDRMHFRCSRCLMTAGFTN